MDRGRGDRDDQHGPVGAAPAQRLPQQGAGRHPGDRRDRQAQHDRADRAAAQLGGTLAAAFATDADPIQFKDGANKDRYANFCRVAPDGTSYPFGKPYGGSAPCKMVTFEAIAPTASYVDRFNFVVDVIHENKPGKKSPLRLLIDPDIRNPGGSGG